jgi:hypothetical protein
MSDKPKSCNDCKFSLSQDFGYSNYTVEGTTFFCLKNLHPEKNGFDEFYGEDKRLNFAQECAGFVEGEGTEIDCDRDAEGPDGDLSAYNSDPEVQELLKAWEAA